EVARGGTRRARIGPTRLRPPLRSHYDASLTARRRTMIVSRCSLVVLVASLLPLTAFAQTPPSEAAAEVNGRPILAADLDAKLGPSLSKLQEQMYALRQKQLDAMIDERLLEDEAARRKVTIAALVEAEITSKVMPATTEDATKFFEENKDKLKGDYKTLEDQIKKFLNAQR